MSDYSIMRCSIRDRCAKQAQEIERLRAAHDHQHGVAGTMLREAERYGRDNDALKEQVVQLRRVLSDAYETFIEGLYRPGRCDCDPSVGMDSCLVCEVRQIIGEVDDERAVQARD